MKVRAPAKVNLQLRILGRRADGFHDIETIIMPVSLSDELTIEISSGDVISLTCDDPELPIDQSNLARAAAHEFQQETGLRFAASIQLRKHIPIAGGLGGGSSDAAAVLSALDQLLDSRLGIESLQKIAARIGSDVPFFVHPGPAICRGRGEIIEPFVAPKNLDVLLMKPPFGVETAWAYKAWATARAAPDGLEAEQDLGWIKIFNALERPVFEKFIVLPVMKDWLLNQPEVRAAGMSGSGSTIFALLRDNASGGPLEQRAKALFGKTLWTALCQTSG
jgi:4-diphosphocytidyl-2-C-methyl-D-erythritol kinase